MIIYHVYFLLSIFQFLHLELPQLLLFRLKVLFDFLLLFADKLIDVLNLTVLARHHFDIAIEDMLFGPFRCLLDDHQRRCLSSFTTLLFHDVTTTRLIATIHCHCTTTTLLLLWLNNFILGLLYHIVDRSEILFAWDTFDGSFSAFELIKLILLLFLELPSLSSYPLGLCLSFLLLLTEFLRILLQQSANLAPGHLRNYRYLFEVTRLFINFHFHLIVATRSLGSRAWHGGAVHEVNVTGWEYIATNQDDKAKKYHKSRISHPLWHVVPLIGISTGIRIRVRIELATRAPVRALIFPLLLFLEASLSLIVDPVLPIGSVAFTALVTVGAVLIGAMILPIIICPRFIVWFRAVMTSKVFLVCCVRFRPSIALRVVRIRPSLISLLAAPIMHSRCPPDVVIQRSPILLANDCISFINRFEFRFCFLPSLVARLGRGTIGMVLLR